MNKKWAIVGAVLGATIPFAFRAYEVLLAGHVLPALFCLFWPTTFVAAFNYPQSSSLAALTILGNMLLLGVLAGVLRRAFPVVFALLVILAWTFSPPSNAAMMGQFDQHRSMLQRLAEMSKADPEITRIGLDQFETSDGKSHGIGDDAALLPKQRWIEYRNILGALHLREAIFRRTGSREVYVTTHTLGAWPVSSYYGYLYCPNISSTPSVYVPCMEGRDAGGRDAYSYKSLDSNWYIYKVFRLYEIR